MPDDVVAELDAWLNGQRGFSINLVIQRARDEIVALRKALHAEMMGRPDKWHGFIAEARNEALEEAARVCDILAGRLSGVLPQGDAMMIRAYENAAAAIRALNDKR